MPVADIAPPAAAEAASEAAAMGGGSRANPGAPGKEMAGAFDALEKRGQPSEPAEGRTIPPHPSQKKAEVPAKPPEKPAEKAPPKPEEGKVDDNAPKPGETDKTQEKPAEQQPKPGEPAKPKKPADFLREELANTKKERDTLKAEIAKAKTAPTEAPEYKSLQEKLAKLEKEHAKLNEDLKFTAYERSPEFKAKFETPFNDAYAQGRSKVSALKVTDPATGEVRPGKPEDFDTIMSLPEDQALDLIDAMFGTGSRSQVVNMARAQVIEKFQARKAALEEAGKNLGEREKQIAEFQGELQKQVSSLWEKHTKAETIPEKHKKWFTTKEGDAQESKLLEAGYKQVDRAAAEDARDPNLTPEQREARIGRAAAMRNRAAIYPLLTHRLEQSAARIAELEAKVKAFEDSEPGAGDGDGKPAGEMPTAGVMGTMDAAMSNLDKKAKPAYYL